jgi:hypothetical protein
MIQHIVYLTAIVILLVTVSPKYLGVFKILSLENVLSKSMVMNVRYSILIATLFWMIYTQTQGSKEGYKNSNMSYGKTQQTDAGQYGSAPDSYIYSSSVYDAEQTTELCKPGSNLTPDEREIICNSAPGSAPVSAPGSAPSISEALSNTPMQPSPIYEPGSVLYGGMGYIPSYEQAAYNDKFVFQNQPTVIENAFYDNEGFCKQSDTFGNIEEKCNSLSKDMCASTGCCVLMGGVKCVQGNESGPKRRAIYSDTTIQNRDVYYYQGKCYGNCVQ